MRVVDCECCKFGGKKCGLRHVDVMCLEFRDLSYMPMVERKWCKVCLCIAHILIEKYVHLSQSCCVQVG